MKLTKRTAFNFLRSYFDVLNKLENDEDKLSYLLSIINKSFLDQDPKDLSFIADLSYESQRHQIEKSVKGWKIANKTDLLGNAMPPSIPPPTPPPTLPLPLPPKEEQEQEQGKEQGKEQLTLSPKKKRESFKKPSQEEVFNCFREKMLGSTITATEIEATTFYNFYESKNWMVGKNKMQKWKAAVSGWLSRKKIAKMESNSSGSAVDNLRNSLNIK